MLSVKARFTNEGLTTYPLDISGKIEGEKGNKRTRISVLRHSLKLHWFADLMNVTEEVTIHRPNVSTLLSSAFIRGDLNAATRGPFI